MFHTDIDKEELEMIENMIQQGRVYNFFRNLLTGGVLGFLAFNYKRITNYLLDLVFHSPGVGRMRIETFKKKKVGIVSTEYGEVRVPVIKCPSFELTMGFFTEGGIYEEGLHEISEFRRVNGGHPRFKRVRNHGAYWITDIQKPSQLSGSKQVFGFIESYLDEIVYIFKVSDDMTIDYKKIIYDYEEAILETPSEKEDLTRGVEGLDGEESLPVEEFDLDSCCDCDGEISCEESKCPPGATCEGGVCVLDQE